MKPVLDLCRKALETVIMVSDEGQLDQAQLHIIALCARLSDMDDGRVQRLVGLGMVCSILENMCKGDGGEQKD